MFGILLKKQLAETYATYFVRKNKKTGKTPKGGAGLAVLLLAVYVFVAFSFFAMSMGLTEALLPVGLDRVFLSVMVLFSVFFGVLGSVFSTYSGLYCCKDNDLLLSMPVPPSAVLLARLVGVYVTGLVFEALVLLPSLVCYWVRRPPTAFAVVFGLLLVPVLGLFVLTVTCLLGWVVAAISARVKNKGLVITLLSLVMLGGYYVVYFRFMNMLNDILVYADGLEALLGGAFLPLNTVARALQGEPVPFLIAVAVCVALGALTLLLLSRTFLRLATASDVVKKKAFTLGKTERLPVGKALLKREFKRFFGSSNYLLNMGLGLVLLPAATVVLAVKAGDLDSLFAMLGTVLPEAIVASIPGAAAVLCALMLGMCAIASPSVSLEGQTVWILRSLPVPEAEILRAKLRLHILPCVVVGVPCAVVGAVLLRADVLSTIFSALAVVSVVALQACLSLNADLHHPNLSWTSEVVPVKQGISVLVALALNVLVGLATAAVVFLAVFVPLWARLCAVAVLAALAALLLRHNILTDGLERWRTAE